MKLAQGDDMRVAKDRAFGRGNAPGVSPWGFLLLTLLLPACGEWGVNESRDVHGFMALHRAVDASDVEAVNALFAQGANANVQDLDGVTPLHRVARNGEVDMARLLLQHYADPRLRTKERWDALHIAAWNEKPEMVKLLLSHGAIVNHKTPGGWTAIHMAAMKGNTEIADLCTLNWAGHGVGGRPSLDAEDERGDTPLLIAVRHKQSAMAIWLIMKGVYANAADANGNTSLHLLAGTGDTEVATKLILFGPADVNACNAEGLTPYAAAVEKEDHALAKLIWKHGGR